MYHPQNPYQPLLRTENIDPLISTVDQLNSEIENNETALFELCKILDCGGFHFPKTVSDSNDESNRKSTADNDALFYLIEQKYNLPHSVSKSREGRLQNLRDQVKLMAMLRESKLEKNKKLLQLLHDYEDDIVLRVLPELRKKLDCAEREDVEQRQVDQKFQREAKLFRKYVDKIQELDQLYAKVNKLVTVLDVAEMANGEGTKE
ncbi:hypothetical protein CANMA_001383 [Candida margitis]|uniref:uncharacterized protein n=1 Tax=Candida margitis TaxID=1775924 RepID=UPI00222711C9|nr:uncharacterized protein CANMA_001383 [Candida margitis]KAI5969583.1 hypothetical protein CANMA_001383 [Candida margitis]